MNIIIVGGGLAGTLAAKTLRELDRDVEIDVFGDERYPYYPRPNLIEYLAGRLPFEKLFAFPEGWADRQRIRLHLGEKVTGIRRVETKDRNGVGLRPVLRRSPPRDRRPGGLASHRRHRPERRFRAEDARRRAKPHRASRRSQAGRDPRGGPARPRDRPGHPEPGGRGSTSSSSSTGSCPASSIPRPPPFSRASSNGPASPSGSGPSPKRSSVTEGCAASGSNRARPRRMPSSSPPAVKPASELAKEAGLVLGRGIVVDDRMRTSAPGVFAAGDAAEHRGRIYGIIPAAFEQARVAAYNMLGQDKPYGGTIPSNTLKVAGTVPDVRGRDRRRGAGLRVARPLRSRSGAVQEDRPPGRPSRRGHLDGHEDRGLGDQPARRPQQGRREPEERPARGHFDFAEIL